jgi:hypothetical protein
MKRWIEGTRDGGMMMRKLDESYSGGSRKFDIDLDVQKEERQREILVDPVRELMYRIDECCNAARQRQIELPYQDLEWLHEDRLRSCYRFVVE